MRSGFRVLQVGCVLLALVLVAACGQAPVNPLAGAWSVTAIELADGSVIDPAQPGLFIFADSHYSAVYTNRAEPRPLSVSTRPTRKRWTSFGASSSTPAPTRSAAR